jgi:membrane protein
MMIDLPDSDGGEVQNSPWRDNSPLGPLLRLRNFFRRVMTVVREEYWNGLLSLQAMGLVYTTLLSLVPFLAVVFSVLKAFGVQQQIEPFLVQALAPLGSHGVDLARRLIEFVNNLRAGVLGALGLAGLFYTVFSLMSQIEGALNYLWHVRRARSLTRKFSDYFSLALVGPVLVVTAVALTASAQSYWLMQQVLQLPYVGGVVTLVTQVMPFVFLCTAFTFLYKLIPYTRVSFSAALVGGITAGLLWQLVGAAFTAFVARSIYYTAVYSSLAILVVFLIWLYVGWLIVLVGGEVAYVYQHPFAYRPAASGQRRGYVFRAWLALSALVEITRRYVAQEAPWRVTELASTLNVAPVNLEELVTELVRCDLLYRTAEPEGIVLGRPPEQVPVSEVLNFLEGSDSASAESPTESEDPVSQLLAHRNLVLRQAFAGVTLRALASSQFPRPRADGSGSLLPLPSPEAVEMSPGRPDGRRADQ